jgi:hypothetical protein
LTVLWAGDWRNGAMSLKSGIRSTLTSAASPRLIRVFEASPDADTPSYSPPPPPCIRETMASEVSAALTLTFAQSALAAMNGLTQSYSLTFEPSSA